jgi:molybdopterin-guanine dinucleotide biosynthesis protein A
MTKAGATGPPTAVRYADILFVDGVLDPNGQNPKPRRVVVLTPNTALAANFPIVAAPVTSQVPPVLTTDHVLLPFKNPPGTRHPATGLFLPLPLTQHTQEQRWPMTLGAVVLCGGQSRRMGEPKAWLPFGPERLLQRVVRLVGEGIGGGPIVVVAAPGQECPPLPSPPAVTIVRDEVSGRGPLQGLAAGLKALPESVDLAYASATDVPFLAPAWIGRLRDLIGGDDLAIPFVDGYHHPLAALYRRATVLPVITELLRADRLRPVFLMESARTRVVTADELRTVDPNLGTLRNLNMPEDYRRALNEL